ncbi:MAG: hypothetical protein WD467_00895 [Candidatus Saccharimonadales bacterium]
MRPNIEAKLTRSLVGEQEMGLLGARVYSLVELEQVERLQLGELKAVGEHPQSNRDRYGNDLIDLYAARHPNYSTYSPGIRNASLYAFLSPPWHIESNRQMVALNVDSTRVFIAHQNRNLPFYTQAWQQAHLGLLDKFPVDLVEEVLDLPLRYPEVRNRFNTSSLAWMPEPILDGLLTEFGPAIEDYLDSWQSLAEFEAGSCDLADNWEVIIPYAVLQPASAVAA